MLLIAALAAARPTDGGMYAFDATDDVRSLDGPAGTVRVWYSAAGPNVVRAGDDDGDGLPDFAQEVAATAEDVLEVYAGLGFREPVSDGDGGGTTAMDAYLVDFGGDADGHYSAERCDGSRCSGYFVMENDFAGYGYGDVSEAVRVLTSHELFHAVQAAYDANEEVWFSEGTAVWAERAYDPDSWDFLAFCDAYLDDTGRSLDEPPAGPVPTFAYATALWWWFLADRYGDDVIVALLEATEGDGDTLAAMAALEEERGGSLAGDWETFARWNLATGRRAGVAESYPFADDIGPVKASADGPAIEDDNRYYPLAATYYELEHAGGPLAFALAEEAPHLAFSLHAEDGEGRVTDAIATFAGTDTDLGELDAGTYWLVGSNPTLATNSTKVLTCLGADVSACAAAEEDTGAVAAAPEGCGCRTGSPAGLVPALIGVLLARRMLPGCTPRSSGSSPATRRGSPPTRRRRATPGSPP